MPPPPSDPLHREPRVTPGCVPVGRVNSPWGVRGHVRVSPLTSNPERFEPGSVLLVRGEERRVLDVVRPHGYPIVQFEGYTDRNSAELLRDTYVEIRKEDLPELPPGEHYIHDLVGLAVEDRSGEVIGTLHDVLETGANDVYIVRREGQNDALIPAIPDIVLEIDIDGGRIVIEAIPGLLD